MCTTRTEPSTGRELGMGVMRGEIRAGTVWFHLGAWGSFALHDPASNVTIAGAMTESQRVPADVRISIYERLLDDFGS